MAARVATGNHILILDNDAEVLPGSLEAAVQTLESADDIGNWGIVETGAAKGRIAPISRTVEKPKPGTTPSTLAVVGRYVLTPRIFHHLRSMPPGAGGEIQLTDAIAKLVGKQPLHAYRFDGERYDCGSAAGFVIANLAMALGREDVAPAVKEFIERL